MSKLFQEIITLMLYNNIQFELKQGIKDYYLVRLKGSKIVWEIDDHPEDDKVYFYNEKDNCYIYTTTTEYVHQAKCAEYRFYD